MPIKGLGTCMVPRANGAVCGMQIAEGEPIGTLMMLGSPRLGHRRCVDAYLARQADKTNTDWLNDLTRQAKKEEESMVQKFEQQGPGGAVDFAHPQEMVQGSAPLQELSSAEGPIGVGTLATEITPVGGEQVPVPPLDPASQDITIKYTVEWASQIDAWIATASGHTLAAMGDTADEALRALVDNLDQLRSYE